MENPSLTRWKGWGVDYVTVENDAYSVASGHPAQFRFTYEITPLRDGVDRWFLIAMKELEPASA
jgi:hypothetical protein